MTNKSNSSKKRPNEKPVTIKEMQELSKERVGRISKEFEDGFNFITKYDRSVTFFGSARFPEGHPYYEKARSLAGKISKELKYSVLTGGGPGIMGAANQGAFEAGGSSLGMTIRLPHEQKTNLFLTDHINFYYFFTRKVCLSFSAEAYIFFPGGFGTLDEFFEIITLVQTHKVKDVPIILVGLEFWKGLEDFLIRHLLDIATIDNSDLNIYTISDDEDEIIEIIKNAPIRNEQ
jgi:uncharacterized protein (TIGR00730 family)